MFLTGLKGVEMKKALIVIGIMCAGISTATAGEMINKHLPEALKIDLQLRDRFESKDDFDFSDSREDRDMYQLLRLRLGVAYTPVKQVEIYTQLQDARTVNVEDYSKTTLEHFLDFRQLYVSFKDIIASNESIPHTQLTLGRQSLTYGAGRLIGDPDWSNIGQTFEGGRAVVAWDQPNIKTDIFMASLTANKTPREGNDFFDRATQDSMMGYYAVWAVDKKLTVEQYLIYRKANKDISFGPSGSAELEEYTVGGRVVAKELHGFDYEVELGGQAGDFNDKDIDAMMLVAGAGYTLDMAWKPRLGFEFDYASGDTDPTDNTRRTFDNLYPANHNHYGYMDLISLQNLNNYRYSLTLNPTNKLKLTADLHLIYLDTVKDSFYSAARGVTRTSSSSSANAHVGNEVDLWASYKICSYATAVVGYSHLYAGKYLANSGANDDADFGYVSLALNF